MILVTGGTGLSGSYVIRELRRRNLSVRALARQASAGKIDGPGIEIALGDLSDLDSLRRACQGVTGIVHAACTFTDSAVDIAAMQALLDGWQDGPFVFFSSLDVYGLSPAPLISEETPLATDYNDYAHGKMVSEGLLAAQGRPDFTSLRAPHIWAPHPKARRRLMDQAKGDAVLLPGAHEAEWSQFRDAWIDARDLAWIVAECLTHPLSGAMNVLAGHFVWHDLVAEVMRSTGSAATLVHKPLAKMDESQRRAMQFYAQSWRYDDSRLRAHLGFRPTRAWQETVSEVLRP
jgi:nucleoside-diphosphate-sugar epimerase